MNELVDSISAIEARLCKAIAAPKVVKSDDTIRNSSECLRMGSRGTNGEESLNPEWERDVDANVLMVREAQDIPPMYQVPPSTITWQVPPSTQDVRTLQKVKQSHVA